MDKWYKWIVEPSKKYGTNHPRQLLVTEELVCLIAEDLLPMSLVTSKRFKSFVHSLDPQYQLPSRKHLSTVLLTKKYCEIRAKVLHLLQNASSINLTMDLWTNRQMRLFVGITGHYISNNWQMESVMLCCDCMTTRHTAENNTCFWYK
uniref:HAT C-terminal dimerisation domain-containing protein n=1 Tax=Amphimedon queenslandica TaxID=400682 RepID=A0A1X7VMZ3_AMPQE